jgi:hypothetical protein
VSSLDSAQLWEEHGNRKQRLLAEPPLREGKDGGRPGLLDLVRQEGSQALKLCDRPIDEGRG